MNLKSYRVEVPLTDPSVWWFVRTVRAETAEVAKDEVMQLAISSGYTVDESIAIKATWTD